MAREGCRRKRSPTGDFLAIRQVLEGGKLKKAQASEKKGADDRFKIAGRLWRMRKESW